MTVRAMRSLWRHQRAHTQRARALVGHVRKPLVSVIVPAYNEELTVVESVRALLALDYEAREIVVVNDGSSDGTLELLKRIFQLVPGPRVFAQPLSTATIRRTYRSFTHPSLVVVDKENGGCKADAANAGINVASGELILIIDADTVLDQDALRGAVLSVLEDPDTVAVGVYVAIANGCRIQDGRIVAVGLPRNWLARFQVIEYMRAFLMFRLASAFRNGLLILSGAFGLFRRDAVIAVGGFDRSSIGEDIDLTFRLQRHYRERGQRFRIAFTPRPLGRTQAPEDWASLRAQRCRWRRGLLETLWRHRRLIGNPRYGLIGVLRVPYMTLFEGLGPLLELATYLVVAAAVLTGLLPPHDYGLMVLTWVMLGSAVSLTAVLLNDVTTREYMRGSDLAVLVLVALLENCGYRQVNSWWAWVGTAQALTGKRGWGVMKRRAFKSEKAPL
jgi:cellulose synthase/poly-beta-1,6-N-acetylglucosamine synthase-like glycosyltransferase